MSGSTSAFRAFLAAAIACGTAPAAEPRMLEALVSRLGSDEFSERQSATEELIGLGAAQPAAVQRVCLHHLRNSPDPEVRLRCRSILRDLLAGRSGFIGIHHARRGNVVEVTHVVPDLAAARGGVQRGDLILAVNRKNLDPNDPQQDLIRRVTESGPGSALALLVLREGERLTLKLTTVRRPPDRESEAAAEAMLRKWLAGQKPDVP